MRRKKFVVTILAIMITIVFVTDGAVVIAGAYGNSANATDMDHPSYYVGTFSLMNASKNNTSTGHIEYVGSLYQCDRSSEYTHLKLNVYVYVNLSDSTMFYIICAAINAVGGSNIASGVSAPNGTSIYASTGSWLEMVGGCQILNLDNVVTLPKSASNQISSIIRNQCNPNSEKSHEILSGSNLVGYRGQWCIKGQTYYQFEIIVEQKIQIGGKISGHIEVGGYTSYYKPGAFGIGKTLELSYSAISENIEFNSGLLR